MTAYHIVVAKNAIFLVAAFAVFHYTANTRTSMNNNHK